MFYWVPDGKMDALREAICTINTIYNGVCPVYSGDMLITIGKNFTFMSDERFVQSFQSVAETDKEKSLLWRLHTLAWAGTHALHVPGDFVECGVLRGFSSAVICKYLDFASVPKTFYLYDTFAGLPAETSSELERANWNAAYSRNDPAELVRRVRETFSTYPNVRIVPGIVPGTLRQTAPPIIAYLHIDMNSVQAEREALEFLFDRVSPGGLIVLDDFGWACSYEQALAQLDFMRQRNYQILELPTGQGLVIKR